MTVRELLCLCKNVNYGFTKVTVFDRNGGKCVSMPGDLPEQVKRLHVSDRGVCKTYAAGSPQRSRVSEGRNRNDCILF